MENVSSLESLDTNTLKLLLKNAMDKKRDEAQGDFLKFVKTVWPEFVEGKHHKIYACLLYTSPSPRDGLLSRMPSSA